MHSLYRFEVASNMLLETTSIHFLAKKKIHSANFLKKRENSAINVRSKGLLKETFENLRD